MDEEEKWAELMRSIRRASRILNWDFNTVDMPDYLDWKAGADLHRRLWDLIYLQNIKNKK